MSGPTYNTARLATRAFTLIELLVVIAVIGILMGLILATAGLASAKKNEAAARAWLDEVAVAIDTYHHAHGFYPPDHPGQPDRSPLAYELHGATYQPAQGQFYNLWSADTVPTNALASWLGVDGIVNSDQDNLIHWPKANVANVNPAITPPVWILTIPVMGPTNHAPFNPINYVSTNPTNNPTTYDLWVDIVMRGHTLRICNWSQQPIALP